ncbi:hypothetical protein MEN24_15805, partial [Dolichospermum sp. ST_sed10]|nr:hypothetical protein [Dolichospermum sp. ST_sed10]
MVIYLQYITYNKELTNHEGAKNTKEEKEEEELRRKNDAFNAFFEDKQLYTVHQEQERHLLH